MLQNPDQSFGALPRKPQRVPCDFSAGCGLRPRLVIIRHLASPIKKIIWRCHAQKSYNIRFNGEYTRRLRSDQNLETVCTEVATESDERAGVARSQSAPKKQRRNYQCFCGF